MTNGWRNSAWTCPPHRRKPMNTASWSLHRTRMETARTIRSCIPPYGLWADCWMIFPLPAVLPAARRVLPARPRRRIQDQGKKWTATCPYLDFMRKMYAEGIIDPEFFTNKYYDDQTKFKQGRVALLHGGIPIFLNLPRRTFPMPRRSTASIPRARGRKRRKPRNEAACRDGRG